MSGSTGIRQTFTITETFPGPQIGKLNMWVIARPFAGTVPTPPPLDPFLIHASGTMRIDPLDIFSASPLFPVPYTVHIVGTSKSPQQQDQLSLTVPYDGMLLGLQFDVQTLDIDLATGQPYAAAWSDNDIAVTIGSGSTGSGQNLVAIAPGTFQMGSTTSNASGESTPVHTTTISYPFWIGKYEVTQSEYSAVMGYNPSGAQNSTSGQRPVENLSWDQAMAYCAKLTEAERSAGRVPPGYAYRLPTEAEWEYCARAGSNADWHTGSAPTCAQANIRPSGLAACTNRTTAVGSYPANAWGIHDTLGNVWEMCLDTFEPYSASVATNPVRNSVALDNKATVRVFRGGNYLNTPDAANVAFRGQFHPTWPFTSVGFRVALAPFSYGNVNPSLNMVPIQPGSFTMGSATAGADSTPVRTVQITKPYWIGKYEVTQAEWSSMMPVNPSPLQNPTHPVANLSWLDAMEYCRKLTQREYANGGIPAGYQYRLPTEAEWELACRAGTTTEYLTGGAPTSSQANFGQNVGSTTPVGAYPANALGLYDMMGNVFEWCIDTYNAAGYGGLASIDPRPNASGQFGRVVRGGAWDTPVFFCASAKRYGIAADAAFPVYGFRVVLAPFEEGTPRQGDDLAFIPPGTFTMGDPFDIPQVNYTPRAPQHQVRISRSFYMGRTEVTFGQYLNITNTPPPTNSPLWVYPAHTVTWDAAKNYCILLNALRAAESRLPLGYNYRLPTEAEWEYACRGGTTTAFYFGNLAACEDFNHNFCVGDIEATTQVGTYSSYRPHPWGLADVHGNVMEWCLDSSNETTSYVDPSQPPQLRIDPTGPSGQSTTPRTKKVFRSGCWIATDGNCTSGTHRVAPRDWFGSGGATAGTGSGIPNNEIGFRVALAPRVAWE